MPNNNTRNISLDDLQEDPGIIFTLLPRRVLTEFDPNKHQDLLRNEIKKVAESNGLEGEQLESFTNSIVTDILFSYDEAEGMRNDLETMTDDQFYRRYGVSKNEVVTKGATQAYREAPIVQSDEDFRYQAAGEDFANIVAQSSALTGEIFSTAKNRISDYANQLNTVRVKAKNAVDLRDEAQRNITAEYLKNAGTLLQSRQNRLTNLSDMVNKHNIKFGSALNDKAIDVLKTFANIAAPTFTSIMLGWEMARQSEADRSAQAIAMQASLDDRALKLEETQAKYYEDVAKSTFQRDLDRANAQIEYFKGQGIDVENQQKLFSELEKSVATGTVNIIDAAARLQGIREQLQRQMEATKLEIEGRKDIAAINAASSVTRAEIAAESKITSADYALSASMFRSAVQRLNNSDNNLTKLDVAYLQEEGALDRLLTRGEQELDLAALNGYIRMNLAELQGDIQQQLENTRQAGQNYRNEQRIRAQQALGLAQLDSKEQIARWNVAANVYKAIQNTNFKYDELGSEEQRFYDRLEAYGDLEAARLNAKSRETEARLEARRIEVADKLAANREIAELGVSRDILIEYLRGESRDRQLANRLDIAIQNSENRVEVANIMQEGQNYRAELAQAGQNYRDEQRIRTQEALGLAQLESKEQIANVRNVLRYMDIMEKRNYNYAALDSAERREISKIERDVWKVNTETEARERREFIKQNYELLRLYAGHELRLNELREKLATDKEMNFDDNTVKLIIQQMRGDQLSDHDKRIAESALEQIQAKREYGIELQNIKEAQANYRKAQELDLKRQGLFGASLNRNLDVLDAMNTYQLMLENPNSVSKGSEEYKNLQNFLAILQPGSKAYTNFMRTAQEQFISRQKAKVKGADPIAAALRGAASSNETATPEEKMEANKTTLLRRVAAMAHQAGINLTGDEIRNLGEEISGEGNEYIPDKYALVLSWKDLDTRVSKALTDFVDKRDKEQKAVRVKEAEERNVKNRSVDQWVRYYADLSPDQIEAIPDQEIREAIQKLGITPSGGYSASKYRQDLHGSFRELMIRKYGGDLNSETPGQEEDKSQQPGAFNYSPFNENQPEEQYAQFNEDQPVEEYAQFDQNKATASGSQDVSSFTSMNVPETRGLAEETFTQEDQPVAFDFYNTGGTGMAIQMIPDDVEGVQQVESMQPLTYGDDTLNGGNPYAAV